MLSGPPAAGALARAVVSRLPAEGALVDLAVYGADRCFRLWGSSKLGAPAGVLALNVSRSSSSAAGLEGELLLRATLVSPRLPRALTLQLGQLAVATQARPRTPVEQPQLPAAAAKPQPRAKMDVAAWRRCYRQYSEWPLLDVPRLHVALWHVDNRLGGSGAPLPPFERLSRWAAAAKLRGCGCAATATGPNVRAGGGVIEYVTQSNNFTALPWNTIDTRHENPARNLYT